MLTPGLGDSRFAPLPGVEHAYIGTTRTVSLLESALHAASGPDPTIYTADLGGWAVSEVELGADIRVADLRDDALALLGILRGELADTGPRHYPCTRVWAARLQSHRPGGHRIAGALWHSRQASLHARAQPDGLFADVVLHSPAEVAVLWSPPGPPAPLAATGGRVELLDGGAPARLIIELSALIGAPIV